MVCMYQNGPSNSGEPVTASLLHVTSNDFPVWSSSMDKRLKVLQKVMAFLAQKCQNAEHCTL